MVKDIPYSIGKEMLRDENGEYDVIRQVYTAKDDIQAADRLITAYLPFIQAETAKLLQRPPIEAQDDELSVAMIAFHEAIGGYSRIRGTFLPYAARRIHHRLIDYRRREQRHQKNLSLKVSAGEEDVSFERTLADEQEPHDALVMREATRTEIEELTRQRASFGVTLSDVADNCPRQQRTRQGCRKALEYAKASPTLLENSCEPNDSRWRSWRPAAVWNARCSSVTASIWWLCC